jgi:preprotein translocase subunit SecY
LRRRCSTFPSTIVEHGLQGQRDRAEDRGDAQHGWLHYLLYGGMIFFFSYFWVATQFQPQQIAEDLKKYGGYVPACVPASRPRTSSTLR